MNPAWLRPLLLVCIFGAVVLAVLYVLVLWVLVVELGGRILGADAPDPDRPGVPDDVARRRALEEADRE